MRCPYCGGTGLVTRLTYFPCDHGAGISYEIDDTVEEECTKCHGTGFIDEMH